MNIYVGNLPYSVQDDELREAFEQYGTVLSAEVIFDRRSQRSRGYGFVEMEDEEAGRNAIAALNGSDFQGRELRVDESKPKSEKGNARAREPQGARGNKPRHSAPQTQASSSGGGIVGFIKRLFG